MFGSLSKLTKKNVSTCRAALQSSHIHLSSRHTESIPLNTRQDSRNVICRTPAVLKDIKTQFSSRIHVRVEHLTDEFDLWRLVGILFFKLHNQSKSSIFERRISRSNNDGIPTSRRGQQRARCRDVWPRPSIVNDGDVPCHHIIRDRGSGNSCRRICLHALQSKSQYLMLNEVYNDKRVANLEVTHQTTPCCGRHGMIGPALELVMCKGRGEAALCK